MFAHLLVPLDGSRLAEAALPHALALAARFDSTLTLARVVGPTFAELTEQVTAVDRLAAREAALYLGDIQYSLREHGFQANYRVLCGRQPAAEIARCAAQLDVDAVVMSTHGRSGISRWVLGSVAEQVLQAVRQPVFLIRVNESHADYDLLAALPSLAAAGA